MLVVKLKDAMEAYRRRTGKRITYAMLAERTGIAHSTLRIAGSVLGYHPTLANIEKICLALDASPGDLLEIIPDPPEAPLKSKAEPKSKAKRKTMKK